MQTREGPAPARSNGKGPELLKALDHPEIETLWRDFMSRTLEDAAVAAFAAEVKHEYQEGAKLKDTVRSVRGITGATYRFPKMGKGLAIQRADVQADIVPMNIAHTNATANIINWIAADYTDIFDDDKTNISEQKELAKSIAMAIERREDQQILDALEAASTSLTVAKNMEDGSTDADLTVAKIRRADRLLGDGGVEETERCFVGSHYGKEALLGATEVTSADYNSVRALVSGDVNTFVGFSFKWIGTRAEGGLDKTSNDRTNFAFAKSAVGMAYGSVQRMEINYIPTKTSWLAAMIYTAGAVAIDAAGIVEVTTTEA